MHASYFQHTQDDRQVTWAEGMDFSKACGCLFVEVGVLGCMC